MSELPRASTGVGGLDDVLGGGFIEGRSYMVRGEPGTGKTIFGLQFLTATDGEALFVGFEEPPDDIRANAASLGIGVEGVDFVDLTADTDWFLGERSYDVFAPDEVEGDSITGEIADAVRNRDPDRIVIDPLSELRSLSPDDYQFRREVSSLVNYLKDEDITAVFTTKATASDDEDLQYLGDGTVELRRAERGRTMEVTKFRGSDFHGGTHTLRIEEGGLSVYPRLVPGDHSQSFSAETVGSGVDELDDLLGGGIERGTVTVVSGPSGVGKTTTGAHFLREAAARGERSAIYLFEESADQFEYRSESIGLGIGEMREEGTLHVEEVEPLDRTADEFAAEIRREVEEEGTQVVMIDGVSGYRLSLRDGGEEALVRELHALCRYLKNMGVTVVLTEENGDVTGDFSPTGTDISYLADNILFLRYLEHRGEIRKAVGVLKKRLGRFEHSLRELEITPDGLDIGEPLTGLRGVLTGTPEWTDSDGGA